METFRNMKPSVVSHHLDTFVESLAEINRRKVAEVVHR